MIDSQILIGLFLTVLPLVELRGGLPVVIEYALRNNLSIWPYFLVVLLLNFFVIFLVFLFLDFLHEHFINWKPYRKTIGKVFDRSHKKADKVKNSSYPYLTLFAFVAVPLPLTGAWTGGIVSWLLGLDRKKSFLSICLGVFVAGLIILLASISLFSVVH